MFELNLITFDIDLESETSTTEEVSAWITKTVGLRKIDTITHFSVFVWWTSYELEDYNRCSTTERLRVIIYIPRI